MSHGRIPATVFRFSVRCVRNINDGLAGLVDLIRQHLFKEEWWRATRQWPGPEVHLDPEPVRPGVVPRSKRPKAKLRAHRQPCWCGNSRYSTCHGAMPAQQELRLLGIDANPPPAKDRTAETPTARPASERAAPELTDS